MNLETDLSDGLALIALIEVLSQKKMSKHNKRPTFRSQKLENVQIALKFLEKEGIKIINIDSSDFVDSKIKLILGLIWLLILHYSISMPIWDADDSPNDKQTPKQRLLNWVKNRIPDYPIHNFTTGKFFLRLNKFNDEIFNCIHVLKCLSWLKKPSKRPSRNLCMKILKKSRSFISGTFQSVT